MGKKPMQDENEQWTARDEALWTTAELAVLTMRGQLGQRQHLPVPFALRLGGPEERIVAHGGFQLLSWHAPGDGSYAHSHGMMVATGRGGLAMMAGFAAAQAIGNASRRRQAAEMAQPRWVPIDHGTVAVSNFGFYLHSPTGIHAWNWHGIHMASLVGPGQLSIDGVSENGPIKWILHSDWAELVFMLWASVCNPTHPQMTDRTWLPQDWMTKAMVHAMSNQGYPTHFAFQEVVRELR
ncbi:MULTISPECIES: hypothetical protein [Arthrobacter]|uniref:Uncharacterized protein n=1 Tax=Arthrobacter bambusae TaxID=1338426 RepID=A0AAW8DK27_9MICC|nr:hypothetical protein [Arthrobacter bambusae]MDP9905964.1 hypothetical protein [Arthrobacter bambusae]MDQ0130195.1 hypothetical protein [Arthrobacter bambusae]MDQ0181575.1 hypothetical protein [Arthrobacter bambusae]